jgi:hypothetical protein
LKLDSISPGTLIATVQHLTSMTEHDDLDIFLAPAEMIISKDLESVTDHIQGHQKHHCGTDSWQTSALPISQLSSCIRRTHLTIAEDLVGAPCG